MGDEGAKVLVVFRGGTAKDKDVFNVGNVEIQVLKDIVHETLDGLGSVSYAKRQWEIQKEQTWWFRSFGYRQGEQESGGKPYEVYVGKGVGAEKVVVILCVWNW
jgi:hypothetical protein